MQAPQAQFYNLNYQVNLPEVNGRPTAGITTSFDAAPLGELRLPIVDPNNAEVSATYAAMWAHHYAPQHDMNPARLAAGAYVVVKYGLFGLLESGEHDGLWVAAQMDPAVPQPQEPVVTVESAQAALTLVIATKINFWTMNHHTGQGGLLGYVKKVVDSLNLEVPGRDFIRAIHQVGHWAGTIRILTHIGIEDLRPIRDFNMNFAIRFNLSSDSRMRVSSFPAGAGKIAIAKAAIDRMIKHPAFRVLPDPQDMAEVLNAYIAISAHRARYHIGAYYLTGAERIAEYDSLGLRVLGRLGTFIDVFYGRTSLANSPVIHGVYMNYEDYSAEFKDYCEALRRGRVPDNVLQRLRGDEHINTDEQIGHVVHALNGIRRVLGREAIVVPGAPQVNIPNVGDNNVL